MAPISEPEPEGEHMIPTPEPENQAKGEPKPEWELAKAKWGAAWEIHWIGIAVLFGILTIITIYCLRKLFMKKRKKQAMAKFAITVTGIIGTFTGSRFLYLIINPYEYNYCMFGKKNCPLFINRFLYSIGLPSLLSAYLLLYLALRDVLKLKKIGSFTKLQNWWFLCGLVVLNYVFACTADLVVAYYTSATLFIILCQGYFIVFSSVLVIAFLHAGISIYLTNKKNKREILKLSRKYRSEEAYTELRKNSQSFVVKVSRLSVITMVLGLAILILQIYALAVVYAGTASGETPEPWPWLSYQFVYRLAELGLAGCILYNISYIPKRNSSRATQKNTLSKRIEANEEGASKGRKKCMFQFQPGTVSLLDFVNVNHTKPVKIKSF